MNPADRIALIERLARAVAWRALSQEERNARIGEAGKLIEELEIGNEQRDRTGWIFVDTSSVDTSSVDIDDDEEGARR